MSLGVVFYHGYAVLLGQLHQWPHLAGLPIEVHRHDGSRARRDGSGYRAHVHIVGSYVWLCEHHRGPHHSHRYSRRDVGVRRHDHFVARADLECAQREVERIQAVGHAHALPHQIERRVLLLEGLQLLPHNEPVSVNHGRSSREQLFAQRPMHRRKIKKRDRRRYYGGRHGAS